ncbi:polycomb group protein Psc-like [Spodoptera frugiperda]|uniref:Polycomb group protein Psc-like n=1 Tax=Spodoptera frugiperda TaxID=7108 RepID=A0A9R0DQV1_SPOFR|nr:polycomb group protein Psc-like [Spodoptera frugiperda]
MVTSNKQPDKKIVKMAEQNTVAVVPQRTLLGEVNEHITCPLCRGYYIDATTIVECLHSFCRSCIIKHLRAKSYCPVCEMMINSAKPNIKLDKALQDIVYKLVPGLFQREMERRQQFYSSRPGPAATATPEQRGEDTERIIFSPEDVISFSLEYADATDTDSISSKSSDSNEPQPVPTTPRRFLQCPAVVNISHLKKFLSMKFDIDSTQFAIDILYKRVPLPDYYTLMDIAYIYNWKRNEPMRFFYQIIDYVAIRNRLFEINKKGSGSGHLRDRKSSPALTEDTNVSSPAPHLNDQGSEASSGTDSPMPDDTTSQASDSIKKVEKAALQSSKNLDESKNLERQSDTPKKNDDEVEKSQFLNSFELTAKSMLPLKSSPIKSSDEQSTSSETPTKNQSKELSPKVEEKVGETSKRKFQTSPHTPELKKLKIELEKAKITNLVTSASATATTTSATTSIQSNRSLDTPIKGKDVEGLSKNSQTPTTVSSPSPMVGPPKEMKQQAMSAKQQEGPGVKRTVSLPQNTSSPKRKPPNDAPLAAQSQGPQKTISPLKLQIPKPETTTANQKQPEVQKPPVKKMPDLKPSVPMSNKGQHINKVRMDLLANNSDPTIDRSKILSQVQSSLGSPMSGSPQSGDPLKSLLDTCKMRIPSSLSITLTDQKLDARNAAEVANTDPKKSMVNKNLAGASNTAHKVPSPPVHNYIEILKLPDTDPKNKKGEGANETKPSQAGKNDGTATPTKPPTKSSESSAKGPVPNLKPISDTKRTFQETFEQQLKSLQADKKSKLTKNKAQVPKLVPATPKAISAANKSSNSTNKPSPNNMPILENKPSTALDLSTPHNLQNQFPQQTLHKAFETMQSIDSLAKKQSLPNKGIPLSMPQNNVFSSSIPNRPLNSGVSPLRIPSTSNLGQLKLDKTSPQLSNRQEMSGTKINPMKPTNTGNSNVPSPNFQMAHTSPSATQPSPRSQTRSPSSSPKLVIAEEKQAGSSGSEQNQSDQITSTQIPSINTNNEQLAVPPGTSKAGLKPMLPAGRIPGIRQPLPTIQKTSPLPNLPDYRLSQARQPLISPQHVLLRHHMEVNAWIEAQRQLELIKSMSTNIAHQSQNDFNNKDKHTFCDLMIMAGVQATIQFRSRKKVYLDEDVTNENKNILNIRKTGERKLKRNIKDLKKDIDDDCTPVKVSRRETVASKVTAKKDSEEENQKPLTSREKEIGWLDNFLTEHLDKEESASLYISGQPGTGKTASLSYILNLPKFKEGYKQVYINCTMMKSAASIYSRICKELQLPTSGTTEKACFNAIEKYLKKKHKMILLVLDEIDQLDSKRQSVLYTIFEWPAMADSRVVLIGIANALDLTERTLPRLQARCSLRPETLHFAPYTKEQIINIFTNVLANEDKSNVFSPVALQMLAAKISAISGDMRRALDIGRRVIELARRTKFSDNQSIDNMMKDSTVTVELKQVLEVLNDVYGGSRKIESDAEDGFPLQQKLILCSIMLMLTKGKVKEILMGKLHDVYKKVATARNIVPLDMCEMSAACGLLEARGALRLGAGASARARRLRLQWDRAELAAALRDKPLLSAILDDVSCLPS